MEIYKDYSDSYQFSKETGADPEILERRRFYVYHYDWSAKKILGFRWSKKVEITIETIHFWRNISIIIFKFTPFLLIKSYQCFRIC